MLDSLDPQEKIDEKLDDIIKGLRKLVEENKEQEINRNSTIPEREARIVAPRREATREEFEGMLVQFSKLNYEDQLLVIQVVRHLASSPQSNTLWRYFLKPTVEGTAKLRRISAVEHILYQLERQQNPELPERRIITIPTGALELLDI